MFVYQRVYIIILYIYIYINNQFEPTLEIFGIRYDPLMTIGIHVDHHGSTFSRTGRGVLMGLQASKHRL